MVARRQMTAISPISVNGVNAIPVRSRVIQAAASSPQIQEAAS